MWVRLPCSGLRIRAIRPASTGRSLAKLLVRLREAALPTRVQNSCIEDMPHGSYGKDTRLSSVVMMGSNPIWGTMIINGLDKIADDLAGRVISQVEVFETEKDGRILKINFVGGRVLDIRDCNLYAQFR